MNKGKTILTIGLGSAILIIIGIIFNISINQKKCPLCGNWKLYAYNVTIKNQATNKLPKNNEITLSIDKEKMISEINYNKPTKKTYYYKLSNNNIYYSETKINNLNNEYEFYEYKIINNKLYLYKYYDNKNKKEEYIFTK